MRLLLALSGYSTHSKYTVQEWLDANEDKRINPKGFKRALKHMLPDTAEVKNVGIKDTEQDTQKLESFRDLCT